MEYILVTGAKGQLGNEIQEIVKNRELTGFLFHDIDTLDISDSKVLHDVFNDINIKCVLNCAAYTAVDKAEKEEDKAFAINSYGVKNLVEVCRKYKSRLIHISTDYVFDGQKNTPYKEDDEVNPESVYGASKLEGEKNLSILNDSMIIRTSWLYSSYGNNFVKTILRLAKEREELNVIYDQTGCPTYAADLAQTLLKIASDVQSDRSKFIPGIYHYSNEGVCSWYDLAREILVMSETKCRINPIETHEYPLPAKRPQYSVFNKKKIKSNYHIDIPYWRDSLKVCVEKIMNRHF